MRWLRRAAVLLCTALLAACAAGPNAARPAPRLAVAIGLHNQAAAALARGELAEAEKLYLRALAQERAIEHVDGIAANLIGLAVTYQRAGQPAPAVRTLDLLLRNEVLPFPAAARAAALFVRSTLALADGQDADARTLAEQAAGLCDGTACAFAYRLPELQARVAIVQNDIARAQAFAAQAVAAARQRQDDAALADALRTHANALLFGTPAAGLVPADEALALDKRLARPDRIFASLVLLAKLHADAGDPSQARSYFQRARLVADADGNQAGLAELARMEHELVDASRK